MYVFSQPGKRECCACEKLPAPCTSEQNEKGIALRFFVHVGQRSCCQTGPEQGGNFTHLLSGMKVCGGPKLGLVRDYLLGLIVRQPGRDGTRDTGSRQGSALGAQLVLHGNTDGSGLCAMQATGACWKQPPD